MKKLVVLSLAALMVAAAFSYATTINRDRLIQNVAKDGDNYVAKGGKGLTGFQAVGPLGYADAWRTFAQMQGKSIIASPSGDSVCILYSQYSGSAGNPSNVKFAFTTDGASSWTHYDIVSNRNSRTYAGMAVTSDFTPIVVWQDRTGGTAPWPILATYDEMGFGGGLWSTFIHLTDSAAVYLPACAVGGNTFMVNGFPHGAFGYDATLYMANGNVSDVMGSGIVWQSPWDLTGPWGWKPWVDSPNDDQDAADFQISPDGQTVVALTDEYFDPSAALGGNGYAPCITWSTDAGITWSQGTGKAYLWADTLPPDGYGGGWWYRFDGLWSNGKPHLIYAVDDLSYNGSYIVHSTPATAGNYTDWVNTVVNAPEASHRSGLGYGADWPTINVDAAGNLYVTYITWTGASVKDIWCVVSTDDGATWHKPYLLTASNQDIGWLEAAEFAGGDMIHFMACDYTLVDSLYYGNFSTAPVLAMPAHDPMAEALIPLQWGRPVSDPVIDTINSTNLPGDTIDFVWTWNTKTFHGNYHIQVSADEVFTAPYTWAAGNLECNYFDVGGINPLAAVNVGLPFNGMIYWRVRFEDQTKAAGPWSEVFRFVYEGATINTVDWVPEGVSGNPNQPTYAFSLGTARPNPARTNASISFQLPQTGQYSLRVYDVTGRMVKDLDGSGKAGNNSVSWNVGKVPNGVYFYKLTQGNNIATNRLVVVK